VGVVLFVDRHSHPQRVACQLNGGVDDTAVILEILYGGQHVQAVADLEHSFGIDDIFGHKKQFLSLTCFSLMIVYHIFPPSSRRI
jgi:hypothetical protein